MEWRQGDPAPFKSLPSGRQLAAWFWELDDRRNRGCDGIDLWRDGVDYAYLWVEAMTDHDYYEGYLLDVRVNIDTPPGQIGEVRDFLYLFAGTGPTFETAWHNQPVNFTDPFDKHHARMKSGLHWFADRVVHSLEGLS